MSDTPRTDADIFIARRRRRVALRPKVPAPAPTLSCLTPEEKEMTMQKLKRAKPVEMP